MRRQTLYTNSEDSEFEDVRFHGVDYILRQGDIIMRSPLEKGRRRPPVNEGEYGVVINEKYVYVFSVQPAKRKSIRELEITVACEDEKGLAEEVKRLADGNQLRQRANPTQ